MKKKYDYFLLIRESRLIIIKDLSERLGIKIGDMNEFVSKFTMQFIKDYDNKITHLNNLEMKIKKIKEEVKKLEIEVMRKNPIANSTRGTLNQIETDGSWLDVYDHNNNNNNNSNKRSHNNNSESTPSFVEPTPKRQKPPKTPSTNTSSLSTSSQRSVSEMLSEATNQDLISLFKQEFNTRNIRINSDFFRRINSEEGIILNNF
jgi:hypothetical protein